MGIMFCKCGHSNWVHRKIMKFRGYECDVRIESYEDYKLTLTRCECSEFRTLLDREPSHWTESESEIRDITYCTCGHSYNQHEAAQTLYGSIRCVQGTVSNEDEETGPLEWKNCECKDFSEKVFR